MSNDNDDDKKQMIEDPICHECGSKNTEEDQNRGEICCVECGLVIDANIIDMGKDYRVFSDGEGTNNERHGMGATYTLHDKGLSTDIDWRNRDSSGAPISGKMAGVFRRLRTQQRRTIVKDSKERNLVQALEELRRLAGQMGLPASIREEGAYIYRKAVDAGLVRGRSIEGVVAASIHAACRLHKNAWTLDEIGRFSRTGRKEIGRTFRNIVRRLKLPVYPSRPEEYVPRFCAQLQLSPPIQGLALRILSDKRVIRVSAGRGPTGIAAAVVYMCAMMKKNNRTQREVAQAAGVTEVTIRNRFNEICEALEMDRSNPSYEG